MPTNGESFVKDASTGFLTPSHHTNKTPYGSESKVRFLQLMEETGDLGKTCDVVGVSLTTHYEHMKLDEAYARAVGITLRRMASHLESVMYKNAQEKSGYMDRVTWLRRWFPESWTPKTTISVSTSDNNDIETLFEKLQTEGKLINVEEVK